MLNSLGINKAPKDTRVVVAMSGGVDSSVTAAMLHEQGYDVVGITLQLYDYGSFAGKKGACCAGQDIYDAKRVADDCGFPHYVLNYESHFKQAVIDDFVDTYLQGATPIPCVRCNQKVKFQDLLQTARELNADVMATGHYVKRVQKDDGMGELWRGIDQTKDQSYFLFTTTQEQLDFLRFPLGDMTKAETRALAEKYGLVTADKPDSQDICFVPDGDYANVIRKFRPDALAPGKIVHVDGRILGDHEGVMHYTVGQRKGLGLGGGETGGVPLFVTGLRPEKNEVIVGPREALARNKVLLKDMNWIGDIPLSATPQNVLVKLRSAQEPMQARIYVNIDNTVEVMLDQAYYGVSPGQACVAYSGDRCLGGGWIDRTENTAFSPVSNGE